MHQLQARLASKWSVFTLSACNTHAGTAHRRHVPDCGRTAITGYVRNFVIVISTTLPTDMDAIWHKVLRTNINMINNVMNFSSNFKNQNINNNIPQNAMDKYVINNVVNHYNHGIKESMFGDKYYTPRVRTRSSTPRTDVNYAKKEDENGDKLNVDMMLM